MSQEEKHLSSEQIECLIETLSGVPEGDGQSELLGEAHHHLANCEECQRLVSMHEEFDRRLQGLKCEAPEDVTRDCPPEQSLSELAAGVSNPDQSEKLMAHAAQCAHCGPILRRATEVFSDSESASERSDLAKLRSGTREWQSSITRQITRSIEDQTGHNDRFIFRPRSRRQILANRPMLISTSTVLFVTACLVLFLYFRTPPVEEVLARAYSERRTFELRIPGAPYSALTTKRGEGESEFDRPSSLGIAEQLIVQKLARNPNDARWLAAKGRANLLDHEYGNAIQNLKSALALSPGSSPIRIDLASAYSQDAINDRPWQNGEAVELLKGVLRKEPRNAVAIFNLGLVLERESLFGEAANQWRSYLTVDSRGGWADEARRKLAKDEERIAKPSTRSPLMDPRRLSAAADRNLDQAQSVVDNNVEDYIKEGTIRWLPVAYCCQKVSPEAENYRASLNIVANVAMSRHRDKWLLELLGNPLNPRAVLRLSRAVLANDGGNYAEGAREARLAGQSFISSNVAGYLRARLEEAYSARLSHNALKCERLARTVVQDSRVRRYGWILTQATLEREECLSMLGETKLAQSLSVVALGEAKQSAYPELYLRALFFAADVDAMSGDLNSAWRQTHDGLALSVASGQSMMRTYSFETELDILTDQAGKKSFDEVILSEAIRTIDGDQDILLRAMAHHRLAEVALSVGDTPNANENFRVALNLFAAAPNSAVTNNHRTEAEIGLARAELQHGDFVEAVDRLKAVNESDLNVSNRYLLLEYYQSLGDAKAKLGDLTGAAKAFGAALALTESTLSNLRSDKERIDWDHAAGGIYRNVVELRLQQHDEEAALELWEWYKGASIRTSSGLDDSALVDNGNISPTYLNTIAAHLPDLQEVHRQLPLLVNETVISFAVLRDGIAAWAYDNRGIQFHWISDKNGEFATRAQRFAELCADPRSDQHTLGVLGRVLYDGLVAPFRKRFSGGRTLVVIPDGTLWSIPLQALMQPDGKYLIESVALVEIPGFYFRQTLRAVKPFTGKETVLVIAVPETIEFNGMTLPELPEVERESASVAAKFPNSIILQSTQRSAGVVNSYLPRAEIFHFAGHAVKTEGGVALVIATSLHKGQKPQTITVSSIGSVRLESLRLVVLSACSTENSADSNSLSDEGSLARALLRAGIPQVVASSWSVDSGATESFMDVFYQALLHGQPTAQGLRQAMLRVRSQPGRQHPYYWAAFSNFGSV